MIWFRDNQLGLLLWSEYISDLIVPMVCMCDVTYICVEYTNQVCSLDLRIIKGAKSRTWQKGGQGGDTANHASLTYQARISPRSHEVGNS